MDFFEGASVAKTAIDLAKTDNFMNKATGFLGMFMPYAGLEKTAVDLYIEEIKKSNLSPEAKLTWKVMT